MVHFRANSGLVRRNSRWVVYVWLIFLFTGCSPKIIYTQNSIRKNGGVERRKQVRKLTKYNQKQMIRVRKKVSNSRVKKMKKRRKYS